MPKIKDARILDLLKDKFFEGHVAMHLAREGLIQPPGFHMAMKLLGGPGSGKDFLEMHNLVLRVFKYLLQYQGIQYPIAQWDLKYPKNLPTEIQDLFRDYPEYLPAVFEGVQKRIDKADRYADPKDKDAAIDALGTFIEQGHPREPGFGFHDTLHDYLGAKEGGFARGAEMNKLRNSVNNDYFWALHIWIDGQYKDILEKLGLPYSNDPISPADAMALMPGMTGGAMPGMAGGASARGAAAGHQIQTASGEAKRMPHGGEKPAGSHH